MARVWHDPSLMGVSNIETLTITNTILGFLFRSIV